MHGFGPFARIIWIVNWSDGVGPLVCRGRGALDRLSWRAGGGWVYFGQAGRAASQQISACALLPCEAPLIRKAISHAWRRRREASNVEWRVQASAFARVIDPLGRPPST